MMSKWNEKLVTDFLKEYKRHQCLWNPYHKDYYNCRKKNEALQKIIDDLGTPGFTVTDYLQQIKIIREKYKKEQSRIIEELQSQRRYESPFSWYSIVADMLTKVINDEEASATKNVSNSDRKKTQPISTKYSASSDNLQNSKRKEKFVQFRPCKFETSPLSEGTKRSKSAEKSGRSTVKRKVVTSNKTRSGYVACPGSKSQQNSTEAVFSIFKSTPDTGPTSIEKYPCASFIAPKHDDLAISERRKNFDPPFLQCPMCGWETACNEEKEKEFREKPVLQQSNIVPCKEYTSDIPLSPVTCTICNNKDVPDHLIDVNHLNHSANSKISHESVACPNVNKVVEVPESYSNAYNTVVQSSPSELKESSEQTKVTARDHVCTQAPIHTQIIRFDPAVAKKILCDRIEAHTRLKIVLANSNGGAREEIPENLKIDQTQSKSYRCSTDSSVQLSTEDNLSNIKSAKEITANTVCYNDQGTQNTVTMADHCISIQSLNNNKIEKQKCCDVAEGTHLSMESKEVEVNIVECVSKGVQNNIGALSGNSTQCSTLENKTKEVGTSMSVCQIVKCQLQERKSAEHICRKNTVTHREMQTKQNETPCERVTCPGLMKEDPAVILQNCIHRALLNAERTVKTGPTTSLSKPSDQKYKCHLGGTCTIDLTEMIKGFKELALNMLNSDAEKLEKLHSFTKTETLKQNDVQSNESMITDEENNSNKTIESSLQLKIVERCPLLMDKEVSVCSNYREIGTGSSLPELTVHKSLPALFLDSVCSNKPKVVSVGTQKRDPILVRVIKCYDNQQTIVKSDKETVTSEVNRDKLAKKCCDRCTETSERLTCQPRNVCRKINTGNDRLDFQQYCEKSRNDTTRSNTSKNCTSSKDCKDKKAVQASNWKGIANIDTSLNICEYKVPQCLRPPKMTCQRKQLIERHAD